MFQVDPAKHTYDAFLCFFQAARSLTENKNVFFADGVRVEIGKEDGLVTLDGKNIKVYSADEFAELMSTHKKSAQVAKTLLYLLRSQVSTELEHAWRGGEYATRLESLRSASKMLFPFTEIEGHTLVFDGKNYYLFEDRRVRLFEDREQAKKFLKNVPESKVSDRLSLSL